MLACTVLNFAGMITRFPTAVEIADSLTGAKNEFWASNEKERDNKNKIDDVIL